MTRIRTYTRFLVAPAFYGSWAALVVGGLCGTYFWDPYVFGLAALVLGGATTLVALVGLPVALLDQTIGSRIKAQIIACIGIALAAVGAAIAMLRAFNWG